MLINDIIYEDDDKRLDLESAVIGCRRKKHDEESCRRRSGTSAPCYLVRLETRRLPILRSLLHRSPPPPFLPRHLFSYQLSLSYPFEISYSSL